MTSTTEVSRGGPAVEARSLSVGYGEKVVVADLDFVLGRGQVLALVGANGSGKTTLLKTLASLLAPVSGDVRVLGAAPGASPTRVAYLGQFHPTEFILPLRAIDVVRMARFASLGLLARSSREDERVVERAMELMRVADLGEEPLDGLSGGQRQRILIAQALARGADLLLLDEPAANLDRGARETYRSVMRDLASAGCSAVVATHDLEEAACSDLALLLAQRVVAFGKPREILTPEALLSAFGIIARHGEGGVLIVEHDHGHSCDADGGMP